GAGRGPCARLGAEGARATGKLAAQRVGVGTQRMMSEESTNPDLVELTHRIWSGIDRGGLGCRTQPLRPGCGVSQGLIAFEGREALRGVFKDTVRSDEDLTSEVE